MMLCVSEQWYILQSGFNLFTITIIMLWYLECNYYIISYCVDYTYARD